MTAVQCLDTHTDDSGRTHRCLKPLGHDDPHCCWREVCQHYTWAQTTALADAVSLADNVIKKLEES